MLEVEQKFHADEFEAIESAVTELGALIEPAITQVDRYFAHPSRDFAQTDEAFRIRRVGETNCVTYKGPKIDSDTKTRREIELPMPDGEATTEQYTELFQSLGFTVVAEVFKQRRRANFTWHNQKVEIVFDVVKDVGQFVEIELSADESTLESAKSCLLSLAEHLGLQAVERRSYLELLLGE